MFFFTNNHVYRGKIRKNEKFQQLFIKKNLHVRVDFLFFSFSRMPAAPERRTVAAQAPKSVFPANTRGQESVSAEINYNDQRRDEQYQIIPTGPCLSTGYYQIKRSWKRLFLQPFTIVNLLSRVSCVRISTFNIILVLTTSVQVASMQGSLTRL